MNTHDAALALCRSLACFDPPLRPLDALVFLLREQGVPVAEIPQACQVAIEREWAVRSSHYGSYELTREGRKVIEPQATNVRSNLGSLGKYDYHNLVLAELVRHHQPDEAWQSCLRQEPLKQKDLRESLKIPEDKKGRISSVIKTIFGSQQKYAQVCRQPSRRLLGILRAATGETAEATGAADCIDGMVGGSRESERYSPTVHDLRLDSESS